jgi:phosphoribosylglycinamide formyltransferase-1
MKQLKIGVLGSGRGSNFVAIADAIERGEVNAEVVLVGSDVADAMILKEASKRNLPTYICKTSRFKTKLEPEIEQNLAHALKEAGAEIIVLAGYMRVVKESLLQTFPGRILNIHPSLLPKFPGLKAWEQALLAGEKETGCTVHWVNNVIDGGQIIVQAKVPVLSDDTAETLHQRIHGAEHKLYPKVIQDIATGVIRVCK